MSCCKKNCRRGISFSRKLQFLVSSSALAVDKHYLESIIEKVSPRQEKSKHSASRLNNATLATKLIVYEAQTALHFLEERREFWSQQNPDYPSKNNTEIETQQNWDLVMNRMGPQKISVFDQDM